MPNSQVTESCAEPVIIRVKGNRGTKMVFSCTWNENRKNDKDEVSKANVKSGNKGPGLEGCRSLPLSLDALYGSSSCIVKLCPLLSNPTTLGKNPSPVKPVDNLTKVLGNARSFHLTRTLEKHQKLATLSSKSPRENGKILPIGSMMARGEEKGGRNGRKTTAKDAIVVTAKWMNKRLLLIS